MLSFLLYLSLYSCIFKKIVAVNNTIKAVGEKHHEDGRDPFGLLPVPCIRASAYFRVYRRGARTPNKVFSR